MDYKKILNNIYVNSTKGSKLEKNIRKKSISKEDLKRKLLNLLAVATIAGTTISWIGDVSAQTETVNEFISNNRQIVSMNTHRTSDNQGYWYDTNAIAQDIVETNQDLDATIYSVYKNINWNSIKNMNEIMSIMKSYVSDDSEILSYTNFEDYLIQNDFVDGEGKIDISKYERHMREYIVGMQSVDDLKLGGK